MQRRNLYAMTDEAKDWRDFREAHGFTQTTLAQTLGLVLRTVQGIELGEHRPCYTTRKRFAELKRRYAAAEQWRKNA